jgi:hypothetical protein
MKKLDISISKAQLMGFEIKLEKGKACCVGFDCSYD